MNAIEKRARELLAVVLHEMYPDDAGKRYVIDKLLVDELDLVSARGAIRALIAALTPPEGYVLVPVEPTAEMIEAALAGMQAYWAPEVWADMLAARPKVWP